MVPLHSVHVFISIAAFVTGGVQLVFIWNFSGA